MNSGRRTADPGVVPAFVVILTAVAAITYASFLLEWLVSPDLDDMEGYVSELSAVDQPFHWVYSTGDLITGALVIIAATIALRTLRRGPWATLGWVFLLLFGVCAIGDATFPLECAPSLDTGCALRERADKVSFAHQFHAVTSSAVITCAIVALFALSVAARRYGWWPALARWGWWLAIAETISALATLALMITGVWLGIAQRIQIIVLCLSLLLIAWALYADRRAARSPDGRARAAAASAALTEGRRGGWNEGPSPRAAPGEQAGGGDRTVSGTALVRRHEPPSGARL